MNGSGDSSQAVLSNDNLPDSAARFDIHLQRIYVLFNVVWIFVVLVVTYTQIAHTEGFADINWSVANGLFLIAALITLEILVLPWHRLNRNLFMLVPMTGVAVTTAGIYFTGGWGSLLYIYYLFVVVFCIVYFSLWVALFGVGITLLASLSPQLYAPSSPDLIEHLVVQMFVYLALGFVSRYLVQQLDSKEYLRQEYEFKLRKLQELNQHFQREASVDRLTSLFNRSYFERRLQEEAERSRRSNSGFTLIFMDLDDFKQINDARGHMVGDRALTIVAQVLQSNARKIDVVARYGGEEFTVLMPDTPLSGANDFFLRIRKEISDRSTEVLGFPIRISAGAASFPQDASNTETLLELADTAMYQAKRHGKDRIITSFIA